jgi:WD40 repeat protein
MVFKKTHKPPLILGGFLVVLFLITSCQAQSTSSNPEPILLESHSRVDSPMESIIRYDRSSSSLVPIVENATNLSYRQSLSHHNYSSLVSPDKRYIALYVMNAEGIWELGIFDVNQRNSQPIASAKIGSQPPKLHEGFSKDGRYYAFSFYDEKSGVLDMGIFDLTEPGIPLTLPSAYFIDFSVDNQAYALTLSPEGLSIGVVKFNPGDGSSQEIYQPAPTGRLGSILLSPDQQWLLCTDLLTMTLSRLPESGGTPELIYQFTGQNSVVNYDPTGRYLSILDLGGDQQLLKLFDSKFKEIYSLSNVGAASTDFSRDGQFFAYQIFGYPSMELRLTDLHSKTSYSIANNGILYSVQISPNSRYLAYLTIEKIDARTGNLYIVRLSDLKSTKIDSSVSSFKFEADSSLLYVRLDETTLTSHLLHVEEPGSQPVSAAPATSGILFLIQ